MKNVNDFIAEDYGKLPNQVRVDKRLELGARLLYVEIYAKSTQRGYCYASNNNLGECLGASRTTIKRWLRSLENLHYVSSKHFPGKIRHIIPCNPLPKLQESGSTDGPTTRSAGGPRPGPKCDTTRSAGGPILIQGIKKDNNIIINNTIDYSTKPITSDLKKSDPFMGRYSENRISELKSNEKHHRIDLNNLTDTESKQYSDKLQKNRNLALLSINNELKKINANISDLPYDIEEKIIEHTQSNMDWLEILAKEWKLVDDCINNIKSTHTLKLA